jgi:hypothetical protein
MQEAKKKPKIYISGAITGTDDYMERFGMAEKKLTERGYSVVNPAKVNFQLPEDTTYEQYMKMSLVMLSMCDAIYMLDGWEDSKGAALEMQYAKTLDGIRAILYESEYYLEPKNDWRMICNFLRRK